MIAGTATHVSNNVSRRQAGRWAAKEQAAPQEAPPQPAAPPPPPAPVAAAPADMTTKIEQLKELGQLRDAGVLSEAEFEAQKGRILYA